MEILVCGYGNIGKHLFEEIKCLQTHGYAIHIFDKYIDGYKKVDYEKHYDFVFICVPTDLCQDGSADTSAVLDSINSFKNVGVYIIKSAIPVGTCEKIGKDNVLVSPEFWGTTQHCPEQCFMILGGNKFESDKVVQLYNKIKNGYYRYFFTDCKTAELVKYMENCWIATKVTFCNEFASIAKSYGISYSELRELWLADKRVSPSHTLVYNDKPYFDIHCLNKDLPTLITFCNENSIDVPLMKSVLDINKQLKSEN